MKFAYIGLAATICWDGAFSARPVADGGAAELAAVVARRALSRLGSRHRNAASGFAELGLRQASGQCGPQYGRCPGDQCCSSYGFCGDTIDHCHPLFDCQAQYGVCGWPRVPQQTTTSTTSTTSARPTTSTSTSISTTTSTSSTSSATSTTSGGPPTTSTSSIPLPTGSLQVTTNGMCGNNTICIGNPNFGPCCSQFFWCGSSIEYCGAGCQSQFGACLGIPGIPGQPATNVTTTTTTTTTTTPGSPPSTTTRPTTTSTTMTSTRSSTTSTSASPTVTIPPGMRPSTDGRCGNGVTCLGSNYGRCCSQFGYCGDGDQYCPYIVGCQPEFGYCDPRP